MSNEGIRMTCSLMGCSNKHYARGWCIKHYRRWMDRPDVDPGLDLYERRFFERVVEDPTTGCWLWTQRVSDCGGYAEFSVGGRTVNAHRYAYELLITEVPPGLHLDHLCRVHHCANPWHLEPVSFRENIARGVGKHARALREDVCYAGHPYDQANTYLHKGKYRSCRTCSRERGRRRREQQRAAS